MPQKGAKNPKNLVEALFQKRRYPAAIIFLITLVLFIPALENDFTNWDDPDYVLENPLLRTFSFENLKKIFSEFVFFHFHPVTILSYSIEYNLFGPNAFIFHFTNVIFHIFNSILVFFLFRALGMEMFFSFLAGIIFGIHPVHVESVAWISERKDVLSAFFYLAALAIYTENLKNKRSLSGTLVVFSLITLSFLSKIVGVTFPFILIFVDLLFSRKIDVTSVLEKIPFFAVSFLFGMVAVLGQERLLNQDLVPHFSYSAWIAANAVIFYIGKFFFPVKLSAIYPHATWEKTFFPFQIEITMVIILIFAGIMVRRLEVRRKILFGFFVFGFVVFPSLPIVIKGYAFAADRYLYLSSIGLFFVFCSSVQDLNYEFGEKTVGKIVGGMALIGILAFCSFQTWNRCHVWRNSETLFQDVLAQFPQEQISHMNLVNYYFVVERYPEAVAYAEKAIKLDPKSVKFRNSLSRSLMKLDRLNESLEQLKISISLEPQNDSTLALLGINLAAQGNFSEAIEAFQNSLKIKPGESKVLFNLALSLESLGKLQEAQEKYQEVIKLSPNPKAEARLGGIFEAKGEFGNAFECFTKALKMEPDNPIFLDGMAHLLTTSKDSRYFNPGKAVELSVLACNMTGFKIKKFTDTLDFAKKVASDLSPSK